MFQIALNWAWGGGGVLVQEYFLVNCPTLLKNKMVCPLVVFCNVKIGNNKKSCCPCVGL